MQQINPPRSFLEKFFPPSPYHKQNLPAVYQTLPEIPAYNLVLWASASALASGQFQKQFIQNISPRLAEEKSPAITFWLRDSSIKSITLRDQKRFTTHGEVEKIAAMIRLREQSEADAKKLLADLQASDYRVAAYQVNNSVPLDYDKNWPNGEPSPGLVSLSFFQAKQCIPDAEFQEYWFCSHTPFAIDIHPLWKYERNAVLNPLNNEAPRWQAIVPLHVRRDSDLAFANFFSHNGKSALANALRIQADVKHFIHLKTIETVAMREYVLR